MMGRVSGKKFFILLWKNMIIKKRHWVMSILEVLVPTVLFVAIVALRTEGGERLNPKYKNETINAAKIYPIYFCEAVYEISKNRNSSTNVELAFSPAASDGAQQVMEKVETAFRLKISAFLYFSALDDSRVGQVTIGRFT